jgi:hypothetical protein
MQEPVEKAECFFYIKERTGTQILQELRKRIERTFRKGKINMGKCCNCGKQITLKEGNTICPACNEEAYKCWSCLEIITPTKICPACGYYICLNCNSCSPSCPIENYTERIAQEDSTLNKTLINKILNIYFTLKNNTDNNRFLCSQNVPISYAKSRIRNFLLKLLGHTTKNLEECARFKKRIQIFKEMPVGNIFTISKIKEDGFYGQEYRDAAYYCVCMGILKVQTKERKDTEGNILNYYEEFERLPLMLPCQYSNYNKIAIKQCKRCKTIYELSDNYCKKCIYKKGKNKNERLPLQLINSCCDFCQLSRQEFKKKVKHESH